MTSLSNGNTYGYDANGNQTSRTIGGTAYALSYDAENRLVKVTWSVSNKMEFTFDGDGNRVKSVLNSSTTTTFIGTYYEVTGSAITKYYYADTSRVAMRTSSGVRYIFGDHLGSTSITADLNGTNSVRQLYKAWGEVRYSSGSLPTKYSFTGQYSYVAGEIGLLYYVARFYDPVLGRYSSPDSIIPIESQGVQAWDRFAYVNNSPLNFIDPTGHGCEDLPAGSREACIKARIEKESDLFSTFTCPPRDYIRTEGVVFRGGAGCPKSTYAAEAEDQYNSSGLSQSVPVVDYFGLLNSILVLLRDDADVVESHSEPGVFADIYFRKNDFGLKITGVMITNMTERDIWIERVYSEIYSSYNKKLRYSDVIYPTLDTNNMCPDPGIASPGSINLIR